ncbi:hypothetical protein EXW72_13785 [Pseudomonas sp. BCA14]|uniref:hypothetical protein n=1 Tax=unclassified Pseudomonas TaxID=196821 RepID=UPI00106EFF53|nr:MULTISPECIES: hypothetical protein [unclassified Pseudomonas]TFF07615.1 hypothetical protein EXW70_17420 [Pseudomonas sp. JMN1]TFF11175.1 hypothetical protein EXW71_15500 [Pseudomonas sp. BCA17]TFF19649.1 hypothetical protein EXW73_24990 [Pseudomonas sp. BCA13]TFF26156.1 hypothetical protein EXW72_13785 [Pseudomonas sp. BCA14]
MDLLHQVVDICKRLAPSGWHNLLLHHGLDILAPNLEQELRKPLSADRTLPGFEDFTLSATRGIEPGKPAHSLLYHAMAHANVTTDAQGHPLQAYPTAAELETVINYVYGCQPPSLEQLKERADGHLMAVVVFAVEYRPAPDTVHKVQADLCFSRTGVSRVGTMAPLYDAQSRGFLPFVEEDSHAIRVLPARYSAYIAVRLKGDSASFGPMRFGEKDATHDFWVPLHKLFNGNECIAGITLDVQLQAQHKNEKLRRIHLQLGAESGWEEHHISQPAFVLTEGLGDWLPERVFGPGLMAATPRKHLVEAARYQGQPLTFNVPTAPQLLVSSLRIPENAPEYVHIRHTVDDAGQVTNLNQRPDMLKVLEKGNFKALHYLDFTADGWIQAQCAALDTAIAQRIPAYSLICAPDFYPLCTQRHLIEWLESLAPDVRNNVFPTPPQCLSDARYPANIQSFPETFTGTDVSITAIIAQLHSVPTLATHLKRPRGASARRASCLPDAGAGVFAPGWDVGIVDHETEQDDVTHLAAYRLGSPFPEDAKLCAALSSFWPAVAPDSAQSYEPNGGAGPTIKPMLDHEIGKDAGFPWDGTPPPRRYNVNDVPHRAYQAYLYADYTENALEGKFSLALTGKVDSQEYQRRIDAFRRVKLSLGDSAAEWFIDAFNIATPDDLKIITCNTHLPVTPLAVGYRLEMFRYKSIASPTHNPLHIQLIDTSTYLIWPHVILRQHGIQPWRCL